MKVTRAIVIHNKNHADRVSLTTDLPSPWPAWVSNDPLSLIFEIRQGKPVEYVKQHFGLTDDDIEEIDQ